jgi:dihydroflavonol-4-reductase
MIVTITGANGFIGLHLVQDQLSKERKVRAVDLKADKLRLLPPNPDLEIIQADIRDKDAMARAVDGSAFVFHLASAHLAVSLPESEYWQINRDAALSLAETCRQAGVRRFVHCSSVGVYGEIKDPPADETSPCHPDLIYEKSKLEGEQAVLAYQRQSGLPLTVLRPVWVYGPGCPRTEKLFRSLRKRTFFYIGDGCSLRHCVHIDDFNHACELAATRPQAVGEIFIIGDAGAVTLRELLGAMAAAASFPIPRLHLPLALVRPLFAAAEKLFLALGREPVVSTRTLKFFTNNTSFSIAKARRLLGFEPQFDVAAGMRRTWAAIRARGSDTAGR